jgi:bifunctional UDP-N-acetylglucosamine pyrophosphorylase/glucosamine-1-phosphate N-acetyltransferase
MAIGPFSTIVLAAGRGTRMKTTLPKVVHPVAGRPMIERALRAVKRLGPEEVRVVVGYGQDLVRQIVEPYGALCYKQEKPLGTAHAVRSADVDTLEGKVLILNGDHPLLNLKDLTKILKEAFEMKSALAVVTCELEEPGSFGRIIRRQGSLQAIVEAKDASHETLKVKEVNTGIYVCDAKVLRKYLPLVESRNAQGEFYLTDIVLLAVQDGVRVDGIKASDRIAFGVNSQKELAMATKKVFLEKAEQLMADGVIIMDPENTYVEDSVTVGAGTTLFPNVFLRGKTSVGEMCVIEPNAWITDAVIGNNVHVKAGSYLQECQVASQCEIGPYAHLRPKAELEEGVKIGNFVEVKNAKMGKKSQAKHLSYLGDAEIGEGTNIGCGTITCNYAADKKKYKTKIGKHAFIGSDTQFVAPVTIGDGAVIGSGSTITKDVPAEALAVTRAKQVIKENYAKKLKE